MKKSIDTNYLDNIYEEKEDPWNFETSDYERVKYNATLEALPRAIYENVFEIGCSIGVLTLLLAAKAKKLLASDAAALPLIKAKKRLENFPHVSFQQMFLPNEFPTQIFDLIVMSEVGYYLNEPDFRLVLDKIMAYLGEHGQLLMVHWTPLVADYPLTGDEVHDMVMEMVAENKLIHLFHKKEKTYRMDLFEKN